MRANSRSAIRRAQAGIGAVLTAAAAVVIAPLTAGADELNRPPELLSFGWVEAEAGVYTLSGQVSDEYPEGCFIQFGGVLSGYFAAVNYDGSFSETFQLGYTEGGPVSAQAVDEVAQESNVLWDDIQ